MEMAYAKNQVRKVLTFDEFVKHISDHNGVFTRGTVKGVVSDTCSCLVEQLLMGNKVQFGELGIFSISITSEPASTLKEFSEDNIKEVNILFNPGEDFENLRSKAEFNLVASRAVQAATIKAVKANETSVDLEAAKKKTTLLTTVATRTRNLLTAIVLQQVAILALILETATTRLTLNNLSVTPDFVSGVTSPRRVFSII